jgi:hypothetical protein
MDTPEYFDVLALDKLGKKQKAVIRANNEDEIANELRLAGAHPLRVERSRRHDPSRPSIAFHEIPSLVKSWTSSEDSIKSMMSAMQHPADDSEKIEFTGMIPLGNFKMKPPYGEEVKGDLCLSKEESAVEIVFVEDASYGDQTIRIGNIRDLADIKVKKGLFRDTITFSTKDNRDYVVNLGFKGARTRVFTRGIHIIEYERKQLQL